MISSLSFNVTSSTTIFLCLGPEKTIPWYNANLYLAFKKERNFLSVFQVLEVL